MVLFMSRPTRRSGSRHAQFQKRVPAPVLRIARGKQVALSLPPETANGPPIQLTVKLIDVLRFSLRTNDKGLREQRHVAVLQQLDRAYQAILEGPRSLSNKERVALSGVLYDTLASGFEDEPVSAEWWKIVGEVAHHALTAPTLTINTFPNEGRLRQLERYVGPFLEAVLLREGVIADDDSRLGLLEAFATALIKAARKLKQNAEGDYTPDPAAARFPKWEGIKPVASASSSPTSLTFDNLLDRWERESAKAPSSLVAFRQHVRAFKEHLKHNDVKSVTRTDVIAWKDALQSQELAAKTINGSYLASIRTLYRLAKRNDLIATDPTEGIGVQSKQRAGEGRLPYDDAEVSAILALADVQTDTRLRWIPWLLALTGARVGEIAQLWGNRVMTVNGVPIIRIAPADDGGTIKNAGSERDVPLHPEIVSRDFLEFVKTRPNGGPLFYGGKQAEARPRKSKTAGHASDGAINRVREWIRESGFADPRKAPSHAFRHWFKTKCADLDIPDSVADAIQGHSDQSAAASYRKISLAKMAEAIRKIEVSASQKQPAGESRRRT